MKSWLTCKTSGQKLPDGIIVSKDRQDKLVCRCPSCGREVLIKGDGTLPRHQKYSIRNKRSFNDGYFDT